MNEFDKDSEDLVNCALEHRKVTGHPVYTSRRELLKQWIRYGAHADQALYNDMFSKLPYELDTDMAPLSKKVPSFE